MALASCPTGRVGRYGEAERSDVVLFAAAGVQSDDDGGASSSHSIVTCAPGGPWMCVSWAAATADGEVAREEEKCDPSLAWLRSSSCAWRWCALGGVRATSSMACRVIRAEMSVS